MHVIVIASQKGGPGKTTLAAHLAVAAELAGVGRAALVDLDPQGSLTAWWNIRESKSPDLIETTIAEFPEKLISLRDLGYALAVIDTPPAITDAIEAVVKQATLVVVPARPSPHDLRAIGNTVDIIQEQEKPFIFVVTQAKPNTRLTVKGVTSLSAHGPVAQVIVHDRVDYAASMIDGHTVQETDPKGRSAEEITALWAFLQDHLAKSMKARKEDRAA
jgi:chromosome partitioning protein